MQHLSREAIQSICTSTPIKCRYPGQHSVGVAKTCSGHALLISGIFQPSDMNNFSTKLWY